MKKLTQRLSAVASVMLLTLTAQAAVGDKITDPSQISNDKCYTITAPRGGYVLNAAGTGTCSSTGSASTAEGADQWALLTIDGDSYYLYNVAAQRFLSSSNGFASDYSTDARIDISDWGDGTFHFNMGTKTLNNNNGGGMIFDNWSNKDDGNRLTLIEAADFDASFLSGKTTVTYNYTIDGATCYTETLDAYVGQPFPITKMPVYSATLAYPEGSVADADKGKTFDVAVTTTTSFVAYPEGTAWENIEKWYLVTMKLDTNYLKYTGADQTKITPTTYNAEEKSAYAFAFIGNPFTGYRIVNHEAGEGKTLANPTDVTVGGSDNGGYCFPILQDVTTTENKYYYAAPSDKRTEGGFFLGMPNGSSVAWMNLRGSDVAYWTGGQDAGSTFVIAETSFTKALSNITFNIVKDGNIVATETLQDCVEGNDYTTTLAYPGAILSQTTATATTTDQTIEVTYTVDDSELPYKFSEDFETAVWMKISIKRSPVKYAAFDGTNVANSTTATDGETSLFALVGDPFGFRLYNLAAGDVPFGSADVNNGTKLTPTTENCNFRMVKSADHYVLKNIDNTGDVYINDNGGYLAYWISSNNLGDAGSNLGFAILDVEDELAAVIASAYDAADYGIPANADVTALHEAIVTAESKVGNALLSDVRALTAAIDAFRASLAETNELYLPDGYYYFKGMESSRNPYLYSDFVGKEEADTYHTDFPETVTNGYIWKVTNNGTSISATNGEGLPLIVGGTSYETLNFGNYNGQAGFFFTEAINLTTWGNDSKLTTWASGGPTKADNRWTFEDVDVDAITNVVVTGAEEGYVTYNGQNAKNGGFFLAADITAEDVTPAEIEGYSCSVVVDGNTLTAYYEISTAIANVQSETAPAAIYNIAGQRISKMQKGIYIVNGKKTAVR